MAHFDRYDILQAYLHYYSSTYSGQFSDEYATVCRIQRLGISLDSSMSANAMEILANLYGEHVCADCAYEAACGDHSDDAVREAVADYRHTWRGVPVRLT